MAARLNPRHSEQVVERIKLRQLVNRLQKNGLGLLKTPEGEPYQLTKSEVTSITWLLERKLARAEAPRNMNVTGTLTLKQMLEGIPSMEEQRADYIRCGGTPDEAG